MDIIDPLLPLREVTRLRNRGRTSTFTDVAAGLLTAPVKTGPGCNAWPASEIAALNRAIIAGKSSDEIRALVQQLHQARKVAA